MPNHASAKKALRQSDKREKINTRSTVAFKEVKKEIKLELGKGEIKKAKANLSKIYSKIDAAVKKTVIHKNTGARIKSRMAALVKKADLASAK
jgi:small subunit ribosomal protein S20